MRLEHNMSRQEWLEWRSNRIGASDVPYLMGISTALERYNLWAVLAGLKKREKLFVNVPMEFGNDVESSILDQYASENKVVVQRQVVFISDTHPILHATVDGAIQHPLSENPEKIVEVKCFSGNNFRLIEQGTLPWSVALQVQTQLHCANAQTGVVICYHATEGSRVIVLEVQRDDVIIDEVLAQVKYMMECVQEMKRIEDYNFRSLRGAEMEINEIIKGYLATLPTEEELARQEQNEMYKKQLQAHAQQIGEGFSKDGVSVRLAKVQGRVNYDAIPELIGVDLTPYRGADTFRATVTVAKPKKKG